MQKNEFSYLLTKRTYHSVSDGHLWFSIFSRPPSNQFTRVQRCTCCFVLLFVSMFLSIMYYDLSKEAKSTDSSKTVGALYISPQQVHDSDECRPDDVRVSDDRWCDRRALRTGPKSVACSTLSAPSSSSETTVTCATSSLSSQTTSANVCREPTEPNMFFSSLLSLQGR